MLLGILNQAVLPIDQMLLGILNQAVLPIDPKLMLNSILYLLMINEKKEEYTSAIRFTSDKSIHGFLYFY